MIVIVIVIIFLKKKEKNENDVFEVIECKKKFDWIQEGAKLV